MTHKSERKQRRVCIVMAVRNGAKFLPEQLESLRCQNLPPFHLVVGDDGSNDGSTQLIIDAVKAWPECGLTLVEGPQEGSAANFISLFEHVPDTADYVAMCDQDDVWLSKKLHTAVSTLEAFDEHNGPMLFGSATWVCGPDLAHRKRSKKMSVDLGFNHALVENYAGGNTMVMNRSGIDLIRKTLHLRSKVLVHDWWIYQLITGAGGKALYDPEPSALYRQHEDNLIGDNGGWRGRLDRIKRVIQGDYRKWTEVNLSVLQELSHLLTPSNAMLVSDISAKRQSALWTRLFIIPTHKLHRQGTSGQIALWIALILKRF